VILKPRVAHNVAAIGGGIFVLYLGVVCVVAISSVASLVPAILVVIGLFWIFVGILGLIRRGRLTITIDRSGISLPAGNWLWSDLRNVLIPREAMAAIYKLECLRGRLIMISLLNGYKIPVQARNYCELKQFLTYCMQFDLPVI
jgi:hypothetical protein